MKALLETLEVLFGLHVPARWYCVHIIVNITDPIKAVVHIRSPVHHHYFRQPQYRISLSKLLSAAYYCVGEEAQPTVIVSAALSFSLTSKTCCCPPASPATSMYNQPPATFLYTARDDTKFLYPSRLTTNVYASSFLEPINDSIMHNTL